MNRGKLSHLSPEEKKEHKRKYRREYYHKNKTRLRIKMNAYHKKHKLKWTYGITEEQYFKMLEDQNSECAICGIGDGSKRWTDSQYPLAVDHDHIHNNVRGLLCDNCNVMLGHAKDSINILVNAAVYLQKQGTYGRSN